MYNEGLNHRSSPIRLEKRKKPNLLEEKKMIVIFLSQIISIYFLRNASNTLLLAKIQMYTTK